MEQIERKVHSAPDSNSKLISIIQEMRIRHWIKNGFVVAPILFAGKWSQLDAWAKCLVCVLAFSLVSSAVYLINDIADRKRDKNHPTKSKRPIASGRLSIGAAIVASLLIMIAGEALAGVVAIYDFDPNGPIFGLGVLLWVNFYLVLNLLYSFWLKQYWIVDVIFIAMGFVLRAMAGAAAISVPISPWLVVCTFSLCLFIALTKRRSEILVLGSERASASRDVNQSYNPEDIEYMLTVSTATAILTYSLYCLAPQTIHVTVGSAHMVWTIPLVVYGIFRFNRITKEAGNEDPVRALIRDKIMWIVVILYLFLAAAIIKYGSNSAFHFMLEVGV